MSLFPSAARLASYAGTTPRVHSLVIFHGRFNSNPNYVKKQIARHLRSRYVRLLEEEVTRLRAENRALVNSLLGTAGFPPISLEEDARRGPVALPPVRRRTWTQIARERELAASKAAPEK